MPTLAPKLPYTHPFAGGYPRLGGQPLPTDPDAIDYLNRVAAADGAAVEVGVAMAVDAFVKGCKADGIWGALKASCIMCGARTISGALVPLVGAAPTPQGGWASGDYSRTAGLTGDGAALYLDSNRANNADPQDDNHNFAYVTNIGVRSLLTSAVSLTGINYIDLVTAATPRMFNRSNTGNPSITISATSGPFGTSRNLSSGFDYLHPEGEGTASVVSQTPNARNLLVFTRSNDGVTFTEYGTHTIAFYSTGTSVDLAALDTAVSNLITTIGNAI